MHNKIFYLLLLLLVVFISCDKDFIVETSPKADFNLFIDYLKNDYAYRDYHPFTMEELRQKYLMQIENSNTKTTLADILLNIELNELKDPHVWFHSYEPYVLSQVTANDSLEKEEISPLFYEISLSKKSEYYYSGVVTSNPSIGYIYIKAFNSDIGGTNSLKMEDGVREIDGIIQELIKKNVTSMIVDIRSVAGGSHYIPRYIAQRFIDKTAIYMVEYYPEETSFIKKAWSIKPDGIGFRTGKIALLSNGLTASGGEFFVMAMLQRDNMIHIGSNSVGASGNIVFKDLSNGWNFSITNSRTEFPDGTQYFKVGIAPSIIVKNNRDYGKTHFKDEVITRAIEVLK